MEKQGIVKEGKSPSEESGRKSALVKNGKAFAKGEKDNITPAEEKLAASMSGLYNQSRHGLR